jgi:hypothetical protein
MKQKSNHRHEVMGVSNNPSPLITLWDIKPSCQHFIFPYVFDNIIRKDMGGVLFLPHKNTLFSPPMYNMLYTYNQKLKGGYTR